MTETGTVQCKHKTELGFHFVMTFIISDIKYEQFLKCIAFKSMNGKNGHIRMVYKTQMSNVEVLVSRRRII